MRLIGVAYFLAVAVLSRLAYADWKVEIVPIGVNNLKERSVLVYYTDTYRSARVISPALDELARSGHISLLQTLTVHNLVKDETFQKEVLEQLEKIAPDELRAAKRSAGNMHNSKVKGLRADFAKAVLATPTVAAISAALGTYGLKVSQAESEKLEFDSTGESHRFRCFLWLSVAPIDGH